MSLADGGHLTHGSPVNMSGKNYNFVSYGLDENVLVGIFSLQFNYTTKKTAFLLFRVDQQPFLLWRFFTVPFVLSDYCIPHSS